jgi:uncharacterized protein (TIGR03118 family)
MTRSSFVRMAAVSAAALLAVVAAATAQGGIDNSYTVHPLVSDGFVATPNPPDAQLVNAWGLVSGPTTPWWVSDNGTNVATLYTASGAKIPLAPGVGGGPTGIVFNLAGTGFPVSNGSSRFIFASEDGKIRGWNLGLANAEVTVDRSGAGAIYKGLAYAVTATGPQIYASDFHNARVDVFDASWHSVTIPGAFVDPTLPNGYAPFGIQAIGSWIVVTFAKQGPGADELHGQSLGFVDAFDTAGRLLARVAQHGQLDAPWGLAQAPATFGQFGGDLLVGNFGDGQINAYGQRVNGQFEHDGTLRSSDGGKLTIDGLWALEFGHGAPSNGPVDTLFFTAGPDDESHGLFGSITAG